MNFDVENIYDEEDPRHELHELFRKYQKKEITEDELKSTLETRFKDLVIGVTIRFQDLYAKRNPFVILWGNSLQTLKIDEIENEVRQLSDSYSDFMDTVFALYFLRKAEDILGKEHGKILD